MKPIVIKRADVVEGQCFRYVTHPVGEGPWTVPLVCTNEDLTRALGWMHSSPTYTGKDWLACDVELLYHHTHHASPTPILVSDTHDLAFMAGFSLPAIPAVPAVAANPCIELDIRVAAPITPATTGWTGSLNDAKTIEQAYAHGYAKYGGPNLDPAKVAEWGAALNTPSENQAIAEANGAQHFPLDASGKVNECGRTVMTHDERAAWSARLRELCAASEQKRAAEAPTVRVDAYYEEWE